MNIEFMIEDRVPVTVRMPDYERSLKRKSHKARQNTYVNKPDGDKVKLPCLEWGNSALVLQLAWDEKLYDEMYLWWKSEYDVLGLDFNVELYEYEYGGLIELRYMSDKPLYQVNRKGFESVLELLEANVLDVWKSVPESFRELTELVYVGDWDYLEYGEEIIEEEY